MSFLHINEVTYDIRNRSRIDYCNENHHFQVDKFNKIIGNSIKKYQNDDCFEGSKGKPQNFYSQHLIVSEKIQSNQH